FITIMIEAITTAIFTVITIYANGFKPGIYFRGAVLLMGIVSCILFKTVSPAFWHNCLTIYLTAGSAVLLTLFMLPAQYFLVVDESRLTFDTFIYGSTYIIVFGALVMHYAGFLGALVIATLNVVGNWVLVFSLRPGGTPLNFLTVLTSYAGVSLSLLIIVRDREYRSRRIYLLELLLSAKMRTTVKELSVMPAEAILARAHAYYRPKSQGNVDVAPKVAWTRRTLTWIRRNVFARWSEATEEGRYHEWRHPLFLSNLRRNLVLQIALDLVSAFLDRSSYCTDPNLPHSNSLCGNNGMIVLIIRLAIIPVMLIGLVASFFCRGSAVLAQSILVATFTIRGL
ncbi:hypothetical protein HK101_006623, partial [Irineochytrium annulatum]